MLSMAFQGMTFPFSKEPLVMSSLGRTASCNTSSGTEYAPSSPPTTSTSTTTSGDEPVETAARPDPDRAFKTIKANWFGDHDVYLVCNIRAALSTMDQLRIFCVEIISALDYLRCR